MLDTPIVAGRPLPKRVTAGECWPRRLRRHAIPSTQTGVHPIATGHARVRTYPKLLLALLRCAVDDAQPYRVNFPLEVRAGLSMNR